MDFFYALLLIIHLICWAFPLGAWITNMRTLKQAPGVAHSIATALVTGLILAILAMTVMDKDVSHVKIAVKFVVALVATAIAFVVQSKQKKSADVAPGMFHAVGLAVVCNIAIAVLWN